MSRRSRKTTRALPARKISPRASVEPADDTEKLVSSSKDSKSEDIETDPARSHSHSHPKLSPASQSVPHHDYSEHEITNVPAPVPDTGQPSADTSTIVTPFLLASQTISTTNVSTSRSHQPSKSTFVPLPSLKTQNLTEIEEAAAHSSLSIHPIPTTRPLTTPTASASDSRNFSPQSNNSHLSTTAIIALVVSGGLTFLIVVALVKLIKRPRRRRTPTPSLPILHDGTFLDEKVESEGSPIFGGKERSSPTLQTRNAKGETGLWTWTQYNSGIPKPAPTVTVTRSSSQAQLLAVNQTTQRGLGVDEDVTYIQGQNQGQYLCTGHGNPEAISKTKGLTPVQNAITRAVSRLSTVSMSLYPNSPGGYSQVGADVGVAIDGVAHDGPGNAAVPRYKDRMVASRNRTSMTAPGSAKDTAALRRSQSFAYGGMEPAAPRVASPNGGHGRARIKSTNYTPGSYPRASAAATNYGKQGLDHQQDGSQNRIDGGNSRRGRDLTSALGQASPIPPSPQPTLYPDDSMSVIGEAKVTLTGRSHKKPVPKTCDSPPSDTAALGSLMMVDYAGSKSTASLVNIRPCEAARVTGKSNLKKRVEDGPPRVPSPPPIPSLAQMAMQHADPDYHSPTYSIYGLYDGDRKLSY